MAPAGKRDIRMPLTPFMQAARVRCVAQKWHGRHAQLMTRAFSTARKAHRFGTASRSLELINRMSWNFDRGRMRPLKMHIGSGKMLISVRVLSKNRGTYENSLIVWSNLEVTQFVLDGANIARRSNLSVTRPTRALEEHNKMNKTVVKAKLGAVLSNMPINGCFCLSA